MPFVSTDVEAGGGVGLQQAFHSGCRRANIRLVDVNTKYLDTRIRGYGDAAAYNSRSKNLRFHYKSPNFQKDNVFLRKSYQNHFL